MSNLRRHELRQILRLIREKFTVEGVAVEKNPRAIIGRHILSMYRDASNTGAQIPRNQASALLEYLKADIAHKKLSGKLFPGSTLSSEEKLKRTAATVGLSLPKESEHVKEYAA